MPKVDSSVILQYYWKMIVSSAKKNAILTSQRVKQLQI
jgi:hypothetical protein